jgi:hypothetical protein
MVTRVEIQCINKSDRYNPHERITHVGGKNADGTRWKLTEDQAIQHIGAGTYDFWTKGGGKIADVVVVNHHIRKYLKTTNDGVQPDNLLALPECP